MLCSSLIISDGIAISAKGDMLYYCSISRDTLFGIPTLYLRQNPPLPSSELAKRVIYLGKKAFSDGMTHDRYTNGFLVADEFSESLLIYGDYVNGAVYSWDTNSDLSTATKIACIQLHTLTYFNDSGRELNYNALARYICMGRRHSKSVF